MPAGVPPPTTATPRSVMAGDVVGGAIEPVGVARLRAHVHGPLGEAVHRLHVGGFRLAHAYFAKIEDRHLQLEIEAALADGLAALTVLGGFPGVTTFEQVDEAGGLGEAV